MNQRSRIRPRPSIGRDIDMPLDEWIALRKHSINQSDTILQPIGVDGNIENIDSSRVLNVSLCIISNNIDMKFLLQEETADVDSEDPNVNEGCKINVKDLYRFI